MKNFIEPCWLKQKAPNVTMIITKYKETFWHPATTFAVNKDRESTQCRQKRPTKQF